MWNRLGPRAAAIACLLLVPIAASAQAISGAVTDATGGLLPGVTVEARSPALIEQVRTAVTDGSGQYSITALVSGEYTVTFSLPGFSRVIREDILLSAGFTANIDAQLAIGSVAETVTVTGETPTVDSPTCNRTVRSTATSSIPSRAASRSRTWAS